MGNQRYLSNKPGCVWRRKKNLERGKYMSRVKKFIGCQVCGYNEHPEVLDFHHLDPADKHEQLYRMRSYSMERIKNEMRKCVVLCANHHRMVEHGYITLDLP